MVKSAQETKKSSRICGCLLVMIVILASLFLTGTAAHAAGKLLLSPSSTKTIIGGTQKINISNLPKKAKVTYKSKNKSIASVSKKGSVKGLKAGKATIIVSVKKGRVTKKLTYKVMVEKPMLSTSNMVLQRGESYSLSIKNRPHKNAKATYTWLSKNKNIASVTNGKVVGISAGTTTVYAKVQIGKRASYLLAAEVTVKDGADGSNDSEMKPTRVIMDRNEATIKTGEQLKLNAIIIPNNAANQEVDWLSSDASIATVSGGMVTGKSPGTVTITARTSNGKSAACKVTVTTSIIAPTGVSLNQSKATIEVGETTALVATVTPDDATDQTVGWSSSNTSVAIVENGMVTGQTAGTATITAQTNNGKTAKCIITVKSSTIAPAGISLNRTTVTIGVGETTTLTATVAPSNASDKTVTWSSDNTSVATVRNGIITGKGTGMATIIAQTNNGKIATCTVTVNPSIIAPTGISLNRTTTTIGVGETMVLTATVIPSDVSDKTVTWNSDDTNIVIVSNGKVEGKAPGSTRITAYTNNGKYATCTVTVKEEISEILPTGISVSPPQEEIQPLCMGIGEQMPLTATVTPSNATNKTVTWSSNDPSIATVNQNGVVTGHSSGDVIIKAMTHNEVESSCYIEVKSAIVKTGKYYHTCSSNGDLIVDATIYLDKPATLGAKNYILYFAYLSGGWQEIGAYNIDSTSWFEERWKCDARIQAYRVDGNKISVKLGFNTSSIDTTSKKEKMFTVSLFPYNSFATGSSLHDSMIMVKLK